MRREPDPEQADRDDSDARGEHKYKNDDQRPRIETSDTAVHRTKGQYAAGADGTQQVSARPQRMNTSQDPLPPSPVAPDRVQPPIEPEK